MTAATGYRERSFLAEDGLRLSFRDYGPIGGDQTPLLCLGGLARNAKDFHRLATERSRRRRILCPDYRGRGRSDRDPNWRNYHPRTYLNDIRHLLALAGVHEVVVIGTSLGGLLGMGMSVLMPTAVRGVVLNDIGPEIELGAMAHVLDYLKRAVPQPDWPSAAAILRQLVPDLSLSSQEEWLEAARATYREGEDGLLHADWDPAIIRAVEASSDLDQDLWPLFRALCARPVLAVRGGVSRILTADTLARMKELRPDMDTVVLDRVGHAPTLNEPAAREALDAFLERV